MPACSLCGVEVRWAETRQGTRVKLERIPAAAGPNRYREVSYQPLQVEAVTETAACLAYPEHNCQRR